MSTDPAVAQFVTGAEAYSRLLESDIVLPQRELALQLLKALLAIYSAGLALPEVDIEQETDEEQFYGEDRGVSLQAIIDKLGGPFYYEKVFEPFDAAEDCTPVTVSLADDLADIYYDLRKGLMRVPENSLVAPPLAVWDWAFHLKIHWGRHAVGAIAALHSLLFGRHALS